MLLLAGGCLSGLVSQVEEEARGLIGEVDFSALLFLCYLEVGALYAAPVRFGFTCSGWLGRSRIAETHDLSGRAGFR